MSGETSSAPTSTLPPQRPAWQTALIVLTVLFAVSEAVYLVLGSIARTCMAEGAACGPLAAGTSNALFVNAVDPGGGATLMNAFAIGLPGFNNLFYLFISGFGIDTAQQLLSTVAASIIIGFLVLWGYFTTSVNRSAGLRLLLAVGFAIGWWVLYNGTEASVYKSEFLGLIFSRYLEIPVGAVSMFVASFFVGHRD